MAPLENKKILSCAFLLDVLCSFRKTVKFVVMSRCLECPHYKRFMKEMDEGDQEEGEEVEKIQKYGYPKVFDVPKE